jgi:hypothetical protein
MLAVKAAKPTPHNRPEQLLDGFFLHDAPATAAETISATDTDGCEQYELVTRSTVVSISAPRTSVTGDSNIVRSALLRAFDGILIEGRYDV